MDSPFTRNPFTMCAESVHHSSGLHSPSCAAYSYRETVSSKQTEQEHLKEETKTSKEELRQTAEGRDGSTRRHQVSFGH